MSCEFCKGKPIDAEYAGEGIKTMYMMLGISPDGTNSIRIEHGNMLTWDNSAGEYAELSAKINYCPMCGNKAIGVSE